MFCSHPLVCSLTEGFSDKPKTCVACHRIAICVVKLICCVLSTSALRHQTSVSLSPSPRPFLGQPSSTLGLSSHSPQRDIGTKLLALDPLHQVLRGFGCGCGCEALPLRCLTLSTS